MNYDEIIVLPVYQAGEQAHLYQCDHYSLVEALRKKHKLCYVKDNLKNLDLSAYIKTQKSVLVFQGAGDIKEMAQSYVQYSSSLIECGIE